MAVCGRKMPNESVLLLVESRDCKVATNPFSEWLKDVASDDVVVNHSNIEAEACGNLWSFSLSLEEAADVSVADVEEFAANVAESRRDGLLRRGAGPMLLYWWHDEQAGQLRFSLVSTVHGRLPFGCEVLAVARLGEIAGDWLRSPHVSGIRRDELFRVTSDQQAPEPIRLVLRVWSLQLP